MLRTRLADADSDIDLLSHCLHVKAPVEQESEATQRALCIFVEFEGMKSAAKEGFQVV